MQAVTPHVNVSWEHGDNEFPIDFLTHSLLIPISILQTRFAGCSVWQRTCHQCPPWESAISIFRRFTEKEFYQREDKKTETSHCSNRLQ